METHPEKFPADGRPDSRRRAEDGGVDAIQGSDRPGFVIYEGQLNFESSQPDFIIWTQGFGRFALQVKGCQ